MDDNTSKARWPRRVTYLACAWSVLYGGLALHWALGGSGFPFGEGDIPDARAESLLGSATAAGTAPVIAGLCFAGALLALLMATVRLRGPARAVILAAAWAGAFTLLALIPDARILAAAGYAPVFLAGLPFGWPEADYFRLAFPWPVQNLLLCLLGGLLWTGAALAWQRRTRGACESCGRSPIASARWTSRESAATWGKWAAYTAFAVPLFYAAVRWAWALRIPVLFSEREIAELHASGLVWGGAGLATVAAAGGALTLGLVQRWGEIWPRWTLFLAGRPVPRAFPLVFASLVTAVLASAGVQAARLTDWGHPSAWLANPMAYWPVWALSLGLATLAFHYRTRPECRRCQAADRLSDRASVIGDS
ncbi:hypothetical protein [Nonomuraea jiangxiensis]|uniref:Uncharacterized protein n=1 Tax=Nonomuraea jiangxiensis TaxID=633440 RepID=A0A1G8WF54_9ACTN|nr:hypothetical protein [Nonomuraea jiangxiensis]SDJ76786.1 hypothetical protein SAMN05421869_112144 [Nonomuraea jiangxiensis]